MSACCKVEMRILDQKKASSPPADPFDLIGDWPARDQLEVMSVEDGADAVLAFHKATKR